MAVWVFLYHLVIHTRQGLGLVKIPISYLSLRKIPCDHMYLKKKKSLLKCQKSQWLNRIHSTFPGPALGVSLWGVQLQKGTWIRTIILTWQGIERKFSRWIFSNSFYVQQIKISPLVKFFRYHWDTHFQISMIYFVSTNSQKTLQTLGIDTVNPLNANPKKWSSTLKQFAGYCWQIMSVFDHFVGLVFIGLK